ncbi:uncharacterized protein CIMG_10956 [Coccidioides immitis RS]|uniref:Uncharacterized protein n=4 Tax=Coccidioides immitis TaxID=5501 RepID=A0A0D8JS91_COCIM|nr:uncharacterized protein CIMG_10956 [Coccidioides immitis RS]KJF60009.1 hypothetical protein CIMG_10956 [Coccidioides immitis RS]KMP10028.1 hypothetical protein CIRG_09261 [Coccidioides immitis RMSCC 2394]KMU81079.1 hypothetical protein CISG_02458 [Coccidioides immitis RMSCC 3703]KMU86539.1 hypothetical protein CIHG_04328 [Coccidioides immitis H538.4]
MSPVLLVSSQKTRLFSNDYVEGCFGVGVQPKARCESNLRGSYKAHGIADEGSMSNAFLFGLRNHLDVGCLSGYLVWACAMDPGRPHILLGRAHNPTVLSCFPAQ